jgi:nucleoside-diphosphate kinase
MEQTLFILKPDVVKRNLIGKILSIIETEGYTITKMKMMAMDKETASRFYSIHKEKSFFGDLITFITSSQCIACVLEKENAVGDLRKLIGETDPLKSPPDSIRRCFGTDIQMNGVHASDSIENAKREISILFG